MPKPDRPRHRNQDTRPRGSLKPQFRASMDGNGVLELLIYGDIVDAATISMLEAWGYSTDGFVSALGVKKALDESRLCTSVRLRINSGGGDAFEGMAINSLICSLGKPVEVWVDGIAASAASIIAMAGSKRIMGRTAMMMIHQAWTYVSGNARDLRKMADTLDKIGESIGVAYADRTGRTAAEIQKLMDDETWLSAQDCVDQGFATEIVQLTEEEEGAAMAMARKFSARLNKQRLPDALKAKKKADDDEEEDDDSKCQCTCDACQDGDCSDCDNPKCDDENCVDCPMQADSDANNKSNLSLFNAQQWMLDKGILRA